MPVFFLTSSLTKLINLFISEKEAFFELMKKLLCLDEILVEEFIPGREIQVAILGKKKLGAIELKPKR